MEITAYNPQKDRLETIEVEFTNGNTTWFGNCRNAHDIYMITDYDGGLLIGEFNKTYPFWIYDISRADIGYDQKKAKQLRKMYE